MKSIEGKEFGYEVGEVGGEIHKIEEAIKKRVTIRSVVPTQKLITEMEEKYAPNAVIRAVSNLVYSGEFREIKGRKQLMREK